MSSPGCHRPPSSPKGGVTVPDAGQADQVGAGWAGATGGRASANATSRASTTAAGYRNGSAGGVRGPDDDDEAARVFPAGKRLRRAAADLLREAVGEGCAARLVVDGGLPVVEPVRLRHVLDPVPVGADAGCDAARVVDVAAAVEDVDGELPGGSKGRGAALRRGASTASAEPDRERE